MALPTEAPRPGGVIHDIGYRPYTGPRLDTDAAARSLFVTGLLNAYGIGRSGRAKGLPMTLLALMVVPAAIMVAVMVTLRLTEPLLNYGTYPVTLMLIIVIFVAAQAPVLFSRDLRSGAISLYLARPLSSTAYALVRWASLFVAILLFIALPVIVLYVGALTAEADIAEQSRDFFAAVVGIVLLSAVLATLSGLVASHTRRRGLAVGVTIIALLVSTGVVTAVQAITAEAGNETAGLLAGLFSPFSLVDGVQVELLGGQSSFQVPPDTTGWGLLYLAVSLALVAGGLWLLVRYYRKQAGR
ncbi:ABC transporter permease subunit [Ornithinimicrobium cavernae]|uniref:ABC transporter permease subunit n=1 Tax=Ornithinimicrobium cavernae TaxID=2666047 RepID=UPI000D685C83|nr:ABC transporter permease subunit [Ornithinimicrobium cavernae]